MTTHQPPPKRDGKRTPRAKRRTLELRKQRQLKAQTRSKER